MKFKLSIFLIISLFFSCSDDSVKLKESDLEGKWNILTAKRNGKETPLLKDGFLQFSNKKFSTNINQNADTITSSFEFSPTLIKTEKFDYNVLMVSGDTLILSTKMMNFNFELSLIKE